MALLGFAVIPLMVFTWMFMLYFMGIGLVLPGLVLLISFCNLTGVSLHLLTDLIFEE